LLERLFPIITMREMCGLCVLMVAIFGIVQTMSFRPQWMRMVILGLIDPPIVGVDRQKNC
jgi:hypothetical protein